MQDTETTTENPPVQPKSDQVKREVETYIRELLFAERPPRLDDDEDLRAREQARQLVHDRMDGDTHLSNSTLGLLAFAPTLPEKQRIRRFCEFLNLEVEA